MYNSCFQLPSSSFIDVLTGLSAADLAIQMPQQYGEEFDANNNYNLMSVDMPGSIRQFQDPTTMDIIQYASVELVGGRPPIRPPKKNDD